VHHSLSYSLQEMNINATLGLGALEEWMPDLRKNFHKTFHKSSGTCMSSSKLPSLLISSAISFFWEWSRQAGRQPDEGGVSAKDQVQVLHSINQSFNQFMIVPQQP
jgi:hypothetical protein